MPATDTSEPSPESLDPDASLMVEAAQGSEEAFVALVRKHQNLLLNFFGRMGALSHGEDLVQETFVRLFRYRNRYRPSARFVSFLYHLARNVWADHGRKIVRMERLAAEIENSTDQDLEHKPPHRTLDVQEALQRLSPKLREVVVLNTYQGLRYQEIVDVLGVPLGTVKSRINLALATLREILE